MEENAGSISHLIDKKQGIELTHKKPDRSGQR